MERPTTTIKTPENKDLILKSYLTARERNEIRTVALEATKVKLDPAGKIAGNDMEVSGSLLAKMQETLIRQVVVSYNGQTNPDAIVNNLLDSIPEEYDFVVEESSKLQTGNLTPAK